MNKYPGYKAKTCNGCGLCCLTTPCAVSVQFNLWQRGRCTALMKTGTSYACGLLVNRLNFGRELARIDHASLVDAIGSGMGCDHRAAWSIDEALDLLAQRNIVDEITDSPLDTYPRGCVLHDQHGMKFLVYMASAYSEAEIYPLLSTGPDMRLAKTVAQFRAGG